MEMVIGMKIMGIITTSINNNDEDENKDDEDEIENEDEGEEDSKDEHNNDHYIRNKIRTIIIIITKSIMLINLMIPILIVKIPTTE